MVILYNMLRKKQYGRKPRRFVGKRRVVKKTQCRVSPCVKKYVKAAFHKQVENKTVSVEANINFGSILESPDLNAYPMLPYSGYLTIPQGVTQSTRVGNTCKIRRVTLNYTLIPLSYNVTTNPSILPVHVILYLGAVKQYKGILPGTGDIGLMYQLGATAIPPTGTLSDLIYKVNKDDWDMKKVWSHKLGYAASEWNGGNSVAQFYTNNDFKMNVVRRMDITKYCAKTLKFNDANSTQQGANLFFMFQSIQSNGTASAASVQNVNIKYFITIDYEDA